MIGAIAAGSDTTAEAGAAVLRAGGNAVDAAVAACFATSVGEPTLTSLAGGGVMLHRDGQTGKVEICDFFSNAPGLGTERPATLDFSSVEVNFGPATQSFHVGAASAAVPGVIPGLCTALDRWGSLPLAEVIKPACRFLRDGVELGPWQARAAALLEGIVLNTAAGRRQFAPFGHLIRAGERYRLPELADTLERLAGGWREVYDGEIRQKILTQFGPGAGGVLGPEDMEAFEVSVLPPLTCSYRGAQIFTNPPPGVGGRMVAFMLRLLETHRPGGATDPDQLHALCRAMRLADEARVEGERQLDVEQVETWRRRFALLEARPLSAAPPGPGGPGSTTHVSVIDSNGDAASVTFSYGEGNGYLIEGTGIMMNNLMGEEDLFPDGFHTWPPGQRLSTMMSPMLMVSPDGDVTVLGTGGANRIRTALIQVVVNLIDHGCSVEQATRAARVHFEAGVLNAEVFGLPDAGAALADLGAEQLVSFEEPSLFFGGVHLVQRRADGRLSGAGDPRRGGAFRIV